MHVCLSEVLADYITAGEWGEEEPLHYLPVRQPGDLRAVLRVVNHLLNQEVSHGVGFFVRQDVINPDQLPGMLRVIPDLPHCQVGQYHAGTDCARQ